MNLVDLINLSYIVKYVKLSRECMSGFECFTSLKVLRGYFQNVTRFERFVVVIIRLLSISYSVNDSEEIVAIFGSLLNVYFERIGSQLLFNCFIQSCFNQLVWNYWFFQFTHFQFATNRINAVVPLFYIRISKLDLKRCQIYFLQKWYLSILWSFQTWFAQNSL